MNTSREQSTSQHKSEPQDIENELPSLPGIRYSMLTERLLMKVLFNSFLALGFCDTLLSPLRYTGGI